MKLSELVAKVEALGEPAKPVAEELKAHVAAIGEVDTKDLAGELVAKADLTVRAEKAEGQVAELSGQVKKLGEDAKGAEALKAKVDAYEAEKREAAVSVAFSAAAKDAGVNPAAIKTARKLADLKDVKVGDDGKVAGLGKELFEGLKAEHPLLFAAEVKESAADAAAPSVPALPPGGTGAAAAPALEIPGAMGLFLKAR